MSVKCWSQKTYTCKKQRETTTFVYEKGLARLGRPLCTICVNMCVYVSLHLFVVTFFCLWVCASLSMSMYVLQSLCYVASVGLPLTVDCLWPALSLCALPRGKVLDRSLYTEPQTQPVAFRPWLFQAPVRLHQSLKEHSFLVCQTNSDGTGLTLWYRRSAGLWKSVSVDFGWTGAEEMLQWWACAL